MERLMASGLNEFEASSAIKNRLTENKELNYQSSNDKSVM
jgi:hypothetical protein